MLTGIEQCKIRFDVEKWQNIKGILFTQNDKKAPSAMAWIAFSGNEQSYSDTEESAIQALKDKLDIIKNFRL